MRFGGTARLLGVALVAALVVASCAGQTPAPARSSASGPSSAPAAPAASSAPTAPAASTGSTAAVAVCPPALPAASPPLGAPTPPPLPGEGPAFRSTSAFSTAVGRETDELIAAIGNPDTGSSSPAWDAFESSLSAGDAGTIRTAAETVIARLRAACAAVSPFFAEPGADPWATDVRGLLDKLAAAVAAMRDAAIGHDPAGAETGRTLMRTALLDHFYQSFKGSSPETYRYTLRDGRTATASHSRWSNQVNFAFDGDAATTWLAGGVAPPQWIELDFGWEATITGIRLLTYQESAGTTDHRVTVRTATGEEREIVRFAGATRDGDWLEYADPAPVERVRYVRVTTLATPSMIGWREIEVSVAAGAALGPCPASTTPLTDVARTRSDPSTGVSDPALAVDGDESTGWDPGPIRGVDDARGWIRTWYARQVYVSEVRVLLGTGSPSAKYDVALFPPGEMGTTLGTLGPIPAQGGWVSIAGPNPCLPFESVYVRVQSKEPAGTIREIQVVGAAAP